MQKSLKKVNNQLEEELYNVKMLREKLVNYEDKLKNISQSNNSYQDNLDTFISKVNTLEKEKESVLEIMKSKEEFYKGEISRIEKSYLEIRDNQIKKLENENELSQSLKLKITQLEALNEESRNENYLSEKRNSELQKQIQYLEETIESLNNKLKCYEEENIYFEKKIYDLEKTNKKLSFEKVNSNDLLLTLIKSKLNSFRSEISNLKAYASNEINNIKKESFKLVDSIMNKIKIFKVSNDKSIEIAIKDQKEQIEKEFIRKCEEKEDELNKEVTKISQKYEKHLLEQFKINEKLEKDNKLIV